MGCGQQREVGPTLRLIEIMRFIKPFRLRHRAIVDDEDVIEEHSSVAQLKATNEECTSVTLEECFQVAINYCLFQTSILIVFFFSFTRKRSNWALRTRGTVLLVTVNKR